MDNPLFDLQERQEAKEAAIKESRRADQKQHADKLLQGIAKIDDNAPNRAIWELTQNACDLTHECRVTIDYSHGKFAFSHNGKPFTSQTLISLIKQVSSKGDTKGEEIGRFGTGFITTHAFGRKFTINSLLNVHGQYVRIRDFEIDRTPTNWEAMVEHLEQQEENVFTIIDKGELTENPEWSTTLTYWPQYETERNNIAHSAKLLPDYIPIVLAINERLVSFTVIAEDGKRKTYSKTSKSEQDGLWKTTIQTSEGIREVFSLQNDTGDLEIVLPLRSAKEAMEFNPAIARLFLYYPLVGTENWGCNFITHSRGFKPTEPRDGLHLKSNNELVQPDEAVNRSLIDEASQLIFNFVQKYAGTIADPIYLAPIAFQTAGDKPLLNDYFRTLQTTWVTHFKQYELVETANHRKAPEKTLFLHQELLQEDVSLVANYDLAQQCWTNLPHQHLAQEWTKIINRWDPGTVFTFKTATELAEQIQNKGKLQAIANTGNLQKHYEYLLKYGYGQLFNKYKLLPNIDGEFRLLTALNKKMHLTPALIEIARVIAPDVPGKHIHEDYTFQFQLTTYKRSDYAKDITAQITKVIGERAKAKNIPPAFFHKTLDYCRIARTADSTSTNARMAKLINAYYEYSTALIEVPAIDNEDIDNRTAQKRVLQVFLNDIADRDAAWVEPNLTVIEEAIKTMSDLKEYNELLQTAKIFPNKLYDLYIQTTLKVDRSIPQELKDMYYNIVKPDLPVDATLIHDQFISYLTRKEERTPNSLGAQIEETLSGDGQYNHINDHPFQSYILRIIELISINEVWANYFPRLAVRKANIMLDRVSGSTRGSMFKLLGLPPDQVEALGKLADQGQIGEVITGFQVNAQMKSILTELESLGAEKVEALEKMALSGHLDEMIAMGLSAWDDHQKKQTDFKFKHAIGKRIENLIKEKVDRDLTQYSIEVDDEQNGQDIVIRKEGNIAFYIEVKSKWKSENPITMSQNQCRRAAENKKIYSLCCVNMTDYKAGESGRYQVDHVDIIFDRIVFLNNIGHALAPLVEGILQYKDIDNDITLTGDYRATIPKKMIDQDGMPLDKFVQFLITQKLELA